MRIGKLISFSFAFSMVSIVNTSAQALRLETAFSTTTVGDTLEVDIVVSGFRRVVSGQFPLTWDTAGLSFLAYEELELQGFVIGQEDVAKGILRCSWISRTGFGQDLIDGTPILKVRFRILGCPGSSYPIDFSGNFPTPEFYQLFDEVPILSELELGVRSVPISTPDLLGPADTLICEPGSLLLSVDCTDCMISWQDGLNTSQREIAAPGIYSIVAINEQNCQLTDTISVGFSSLKPLDLGADTTICSGEMIILDSGQDSGRTIWSTGALSRSISVEIAGDYAVTISETDGTCARTDTIRVHEARRIEGAIQTDSAHICLGDSIRLTAPSGERYDWISGKETLSVTDSAETTAFPLAKTLYEVVVSNICFTDTFSIDIQVVEIDGSAGADTCIVKGTAVELGATGGTSYLWRKDLPLSEFTIPNPLAQPDKSTVFVVEIYNGNCSIIDSVMVTVTDNPLHSILPINAISPNGDGKNDVLYFPNLEKFTTNVLRVFNRWGGKVYDRVNYQKNGGELWGGTHNGKPLPPGDYFYVLTVGEVAIRQTLLIVR